MYGPNLRASCRRMEAAGLLHTLRAPNLQLAVELTDAGDALDALLAHAGFSAGHAQELRWHRIRWGMYCLRCPQKKPETNGDIGRKIM